MTGWSLKATCSHCGQWGTVDDITLVCVRCGQTHELTDDQRQARDADIEVQQAAQRGLARHRSGSDGEI
jgi:Fe2+ or Zn2+ uptake regulation protein